MVGCYKINHREGKEPRKAISSSILRSLKAIASFHLLPRNEISGKLTGKWMSAFYEKEGRDSTNGEERVKKSDE